MNTKDTGWKQPRLSARRFYANTEGGVAPLHFKTNED
jgi:hypothetical protein